MRLLFSVQFVAMVVKFVRKVGFCWCLLILLLMFVGGVAARGPFSLSLRLFVGAAALMLLMLRSPLLFVNVILDVNRSVADVCC